MLQKAIKVAQSAKNRQIWSHWLRRSKKVFVDGQERDRMGHGRGTKLTDVTRASFCYVTSQFDSEDSKTNPDELFVNKSTSFLKTNAATFFPPQNRDH